MERPTLRQLEYFLAVTEHLSFRKGAESCHVSQPALSAQIAQLEAKLGLQLFERASRGVQVTTAGSLLAPAARDALSATAAFGQLASSLGAPLAGPLRLGVIPTVGPYLLPAVLPAVRLAHPDLKVFLREDMTDRLLDLLAEGDLDLLLLAIDLDLGPVETLPLFSDPFLLATSADDELARRSSATLEDLAGRNVLLLDEGHCLRDQTLPLCSAGGAEERGGFRASSLPTIVQMVASGLGLTLLPELAIERELAATPDLALIPFGAQGPSRSIGLAWRPNSPRGGEFRALGATLAKAYAAS